MIFDKANPLLLSKEVCIEDLLLVAKDNPDTTITRDFYRKHSNIDEVNWTGQFGKFSEFLAAAGLGNTRATNKENSQIARHASLDILEKLNNEKQSWADKYLKPSGERFQTIMAGSDFHDIHCDPFYRRLFIDTVRRTKPAVIVLNGDVYDFPEWSKYDQDPRDYDPVVRHKWVYNFLKDCREASADSEIIFVEGNHEHRLCRHLAEKSPQVKSWLHDVHGWDMQKFLGLDVFEVNYYGRANLRVFNQSNMKKELERNTYVYNNQLLFHHFPQGINLGLPGVSGHHHKHTVTPRMSATFGSYEWHQIGGGHIRFNDYQNSMGEQWANGFLLIHVDTERLRSQFEYIDCTSNHCVIGGQWYLRNAEEEIYFR